MLGAQRFSRGFDMSIAIVAAAALAAGPVYLDCTINQDGEAKRFQAALYEETGQAVLTFDAQAVERHHAAFTPASVLVGNYNDGFLIDRKDLSIVQVAVIGRQSFRYEGTCKLQPAPADRAF